MTSVNEFVVQRLELNFKSVYIEGVKILIKLLENIVNHPREERYRKILIRKKFLSEKLFILNDVESVLIAIGYAKNNDGNFVLPFTVPVTIVQEYRDYFYSRLGYVIAFPEDERKPVEVNPLPNAAVVQPIPQIEIPGRPFLEKITFPKVLNVENDNLKFLEEISDRFLQYKDRELQEFTLQHIIPLQTLEDRVTEKISKIQRLIKSQKIGDIEKPIYEDVYLIELLDWFNTSFFQWVDVECKICLKKGANTVFENNIRKEYVDCCGEQTILYRHTDVAQLLKSRQGRAEEFANCFTFICRCLGYDVRYVFSNFGHAWTEIFLPSQDQWIHFDPSKNIFNAPLVYEHYFKNKITYVVAVSIDDIQNVTRRYTLHYDQAVRARTQFDETKLLKAIQKIRKKRQQNLSKVRKSILKTRNAAELVWLKTKHGINEDENVGRSSGTIAWKLCRNENNVCNGYVFELTNIEIKLKQFALRYSCIRNVYERYNHNTGTLMEQYKTWQKCLYECENIFYKKEYDWRKVYLCRTQECDYGRVEWKFDFTKSGLRIEEAFVKFTSETFKNGQVTVWFEHENGNNYKTTEELKNSQKFSIIAELSGGELGYAWQHAQLFREPFYSKDYPFESLFPKEFSACAKIIHEPLVYYEKPDVILINFSFGAESVNGDCTNLGSKLDFKITRDISPIVKDIAAAQIWEESECPHDLLKFSPPPYDEICTHEDYQMLSTISYYEFDVKYKNLPFEDLFEEFRDRLSYIISGLLPDKLELLNLTNKFHLVVHSIPGQDEMEVKINDRAFYAFDILPNLDVVPDLKYETDEKASISLGFIQQCSIINNRLLNFNDEKFNLDSYLSMHPNLCPTLLLADCTENPTLAVFINRYQNVMSSNTTYYSLTVHAGGPFITISPWFNGSPNVIITTDKLCHNLVQEGYIEFPSNDVEDPQVKVYLNEGILIVEHSDVFQTKIQFNGRGILSIQTLRSSKHLLCGLCNEPTNRLSDTPVDEQYTYCDHDVNTSCDFMNDF